jgi:hypothetical protein
MREEQPPVRSRSSEPKPERNGPDGRRSRLIRTDERIRGVSAIKIMVDRGRVELGSRGRRDVRVRTTVLLPRWQTMLGRWWTVLSRRQPAAAAADVAVEAGRLRIDARRGQARVQVDLPVGLAVQAEVGRGELTLWGVGGRLDLVVGEGTLAGRELTATAVRARNRRGEVNLHFSEQPDEVDAWSGGGAVLLILPGEDYTVDTSEPAEVTVPALGGSSEGSSGGGAGSRVRAHSDRGPVSVLAAGSATPI